MEQIDGVVQSSARLRVTGGPPPTHSRPQLLFRQATAAALFFLRTRARNPKPRHSCNSVRRSAAGHPEIRDRDVHCSASNAPRCVACRGRYRSRSRPPRRAACRSSANPYRCRTSCLIEKAVARRPRSRNMPESVFCIERARSGALGAVTAQYAVLLRSELTPPLLVRFFDAARWARGRLLWRHDVSPKMLLYGEYSS